MVYDWLPPEATVVSPAGEMVPLPETEAVMVYWFTQEVPFQRAPVAQVAVPVT